jgi:hypothetical protein
MNNIKISLMLITLSTSIYGQKIDDLIQNIKLEYSFVINYKNEYQKLVLDRTKELYDNEEPDETIRKRTVTYYTENGKIRLISVFEMWDHMYVHETMQEYYFKEDNLFFYFEQRKNISWEGYDDLEKRSTQIEEIRIYYNEKKCIRYLTKSVTGKLYEINKIVQNTVNNDQNCSEAPIINDKIVELKKIYREALQISHS